jgi:hypothetical protein
MNKKNFFYPTRIFRGVLVIFMALLCHTMVYSQQSGIVLKWDSQIGCLEYEEDRKKEAFLEDIEEGECVRVCEHSIVNYTLTGSNIASVSWNVAGGTVQSITGGGLILEVEWGASGGGAVSFDLVLTDDTIISKTLCIEIIDGPLADFTVVSPGGGDQFCANVPIYFTNLSHPDGGSQLVSYFWDFGDGEFSSAYEPSHIYTTSGWYEVKLQVRNECNCVATYAMKIFISETALPISCPTVVCEGAVEVYTVEGSECEIYWEIEGGHVLSYPNSTSVQVVWDNIGPDGYGYVSAKSSCQCPNWTTVKIPVVPLHGVIQGETEMCAPDQERYQLPQWPGTFYEWTLIDLNGNPPGTTLIQTDQLNEVIVDGVYPGKYLLKCTYTNALHDCGGSAELLINIKHTLEIDGDFELCQDDSSTYSSNIGSPSTWKLYKNGVHLTTSTALTFPYTFINDGVYQLKVSHPDACKEVTKIIKVHSTGALSGSITGDTVACTGLPYEYSFPSPGSSYNLVWSVDGGSIQGPDMGNQVQIVFDDPVPSSGYYEISVIKQLKNAPYCESEPKTLHVYPKESGAVVQNIDDEDLFCPSSFTSFSFTSPYMSEIEDILWKIESDAGNSNFGNVVDGQGTDNIEVSWNEIFMGNNTGKVILQIRFCGRLETYEYPVTLRPTPVLTWTDGLTSVCAGELNSFQLSFESDVILESGEIVWDLGQGITHTDYITTPDDTFISPIMHYPNTFDADMNIEISVTVNAPNQCLVPAVVYKTITVKPSPRIAVTPGYNYAVCPDAFGNYSTPTLTANLQAGVSLTGSIEWYKVGSPDVLVGTGMTFVVTQAEGPGYYYAQATATNGCTERSRTFRVVVQCPQPSCTLPFTPTVTAGIAQFTDCHTFKLSGTFNNSGSMAFVNWLYSSSPGMIMTSSDNNNAEFTVTAPGNYMVFYRVGYHNGSGDICTVTRTVHIKVPYISGIRYETVCNGDGTFDVTLLNDSTHILTDAELDDLVYTFYINNSMVQTGNIENYTASSLGAGTYTLALELTHPDYPGILTCRAETEITLVVPDTSFTITHDPNCVENKAILTLNTPTLPGYRYEWGFNGTTFIITDPGIQETLVNLQYEGGIDPSEITLTITDPGGCTFGNSESTDEIVSQANFEGNIEGGGPYCDGDIATLTFITLVTPLPDAYQWMQGNTPIPGATSSTYSPTQNGSYWVILYNEDGCVDKLTPSATVNFYPRPYVDLTGPDTVCADTEFTLQGSVSGGGTLQKRWLRNGLEIQPWSVSTSVVKEFTETTAGIYTYRLEVRIQGNNSCYEWAEFQVEVLELPDADPDYDIFDCQPYSVKLYINSPIPGATYLWSNGDSGSDIVVNEGGAYSVTVITADGCSKTVQLFVPKSPEIYLWVFPSGCAEFCKKEIEQGITLPAPNASFEHYSWNVDTIPDLYGSGFSPDYAVNQFGKLDLTLENEFCSVTSDPLVISEIKDCKECKLRLELKEDKRIDKPYLYYLLSGTIYNTFGQDITISISSATGDGIYIPSTIFIPASGSYTFSPLTFIPYGGFSGGTSYIRFEVRDSKGNLICFDEVKIEYSSAGQARPVVENSLKIMPNPAQTYTTLEYDLGESTQGNIRVFDMTGIQQWEQKITESKGSINFDAYRLPTGNYVVVLFADGKAINQQILIKK